MDGLTRISIADWLPKLEDRLLRPVERISTGFPLFDAGLTTDEGGGGGFVYPSLIVLGAAPKAGKSTLTQMIGENHVNGGENNWCYYLDLENGIERFMKRMIRRGASISDQDLREGLTKHQAAKLTLTQEWMASKGKRLLLQTKKPPSPREFSGEIHAIKKILGPEARILVIIDSLQKLSMALEDRRAGIDGWLRELEELRGTARVCILCISELSRSSGKKYETGTARYKESGDIEYTCDLGLSLGPNGRGKIVLTAEFNRDGPVGPLAEYSPRFEFNTMHERKLSRVKDDEGNEA